MKITDPQVIENGEKDLIASVQEDLDPGMVREILKERLAVAALSPKGGRIVVHDNDIAFRLDFEVNLSGSLLFDRDGNLIDPTSSQDIAEEKAQEAPLAEQQALSPPPRQSEDPDGLDIDVQDSNAGQAVDLEKDQDAPEPKIDDGPAIPEEPLFEDQDDPFPSPGENQPSVPGVEDEDMKAQTGDLDDDINDLLKESREFWAQNKKS